MVKNSLARELIGGITKEFSWREFSDRNRESGRGQKLSELPRHLLVIHDCISFGFLVAVLRRLSIRNGMFRGEEKQNRGKFAAFDKQNTLQEGVVEVDHVCGNGYRVVLP